MDFTNHLFIIGLSFGLISIIAGTHLLKYPPKNINYFYGYRTKRSMKSQEAWKFAQSYSAKIFIRGGVVFIPMGIIGLLVNYHQTCNLAFGLGSLFLFCIFLIYKTEKKLKQNFNNDNKHI